MSHLDAHDRPQQPTPSQAAGWEASPSPYDAHTGYGPGAAPGDGAQPVYGATPAYGAQPAYGTAPGYGAGPGYGAAPAAPVQPPTGQSAWLTGLATYFPIPLLNYIARLVLAIIMHRSAKAQGPVAAANARGALNWCLTFGLWGSSPSSSSASRSSRRSTGPPARPRARGSATASPR